MREWKEKNGGDRTASPANRETLINNLNQSRAQ